jgi:hypothetical protein
MATARKKAKNVALKVEVHHNKKKHSDISLLLYNMSWLYRHLSNKDYLTVHTACLVCFISTFNGHSKKQKAENVALKV